jgi:omega-6 fatty acid desaturase (delta-12 desaturase)
LLRHPLVLFGIGPSVLFGVLYRFPKGSTSKWKTERASVAWTNVALVAVAVLMGVAIGPREYFSIQIPISVIAATAGAWLFYIQHQFENAYWARDGEWNAVDAALRGSTHYDLPAVLQWFTGNIGFHHLHHLDARVASYNLPRCHRENPTLRAAVRLTLRSSLRTMSLALWDERAKKLVAFSEIAAPPT